MSSLPRKGATKSARKPLTHLTEPQANNRTTMSSAPLDSTPLPPRALLPTLENVQDQHARDALFSPAPRAHGDVHASRPRLYTEFNGAGHPSFGPDLNHHSSRPHVEPYAYQEERGRFEAGYDPAVSRKHGLSSLAYPEAAYPYCQPTMHGYGAEYYPSVPAFEPAYLEPGFDHPHAPFQAPHPGEEYGCEQDRKRFKSDDRDTSPEAREAEREDPRSAAANDQQPRLLWQPEDEHHLTDLHCFVRKRCVFMFSATAHDVGTPRKGRKKALNLGQIGIGCLHCKDTESKLKGSTYFPTSISGIYNATMIIQQRHFPACPSVSIETHREYNKLKELTARSASTKEYWVTAAKKMGLVDTPKGVFFRPNEQPSAPVDSKPQAAYTSEALVRLVEPSDKLFATEYAYFVMDQMTRCVFTEADRLGKRKCHKVGFPGLACRHCYGGNGSGRFFPLTLKTFSDVSKSIHVLRNHLVKCPKAPGGMAQTVNALFDRHKEEKSITPFGAQKIFFDQIWKRLHPELQEEAPKKAAKAKRPPAKARKSRARARPTRDDGLQDASLAQAFVPETATPLPPLKSPPVIHRGAPPARPADARPNRELCLIPKKRYTQQPAPDLPALPPRPPPNASYSESDVSVAMILASGFGRQAETEEPPAEQPRQEAV
ncbi:hypothetical protein ACHAXT_007057 [Thalassiosira profunda]